MDGVLTSYAQLQLVDVMMERLRHMMGQIRFFLVIASVAATLWAATRFKSVATSPLQLYLPTLATPPAYEQALDATDAQPALENEGTSVR
jgi:hypothetical protein